MTSSAPAAPTTSPPTSIPKIIFYDLDHTLQPPSRSWSPATIRTALALKHRKLPHTRQAVSYPDIAGLLRSHGVPEPKTPNADNVKYTLPAISLHYEDGKEKWIMDSAAIALVLEDLVPASADHPSLFPLGDKSHEQVLKIRKGGSQAVQIIWNYIAPWVPDFLDSRGAEYFYRTRALDVGRPLQDLQKEMEEKGDFEVELRKAVGFFAKVYLEERPDGDGNGGGNGPYLGGREHPSYPDFVVCAVLEWWRCARGDEVVDGVLRDVEGGILMPVVERLADVVRHG